MTYQSSDYEVPLDSDDHYAICTYYDNHNIKTEVIWKDGYIDGIRKQYFEKGGLYIETPYSDGKKNGKEVFYYENGQIQKYFTMVDGLKDDYSEVYDENGVMKWCTLWENGTEIATGYEQCP